MGRSIRYGAQEDTTVCLGHPAHAVRVNEIICRTCGTLAMGAQLGIYQVQQLLGYGRSGNAYLATHLRSRQPVVIKLFAPDAASADLWDAARREVRVATSLRHPSILPVFSCTLWHPEAQSGTGSSRHDLAPSQRGAYLLTLCQYVPGTLNRFIALHERTGQGTVVEHKIAMIARLVNLVQQIGSVLNSAHKRGIVHGALVPGNILLNGQDRLWVADFGLARLCPPPHPYLAPELAVAGQTCMQTGNMSTYWTAVTPASDQYAFAMLCEQLFTRLLKAVDYEPILPILQCATHQKPSRRFTNIDTFVHELVAHITRGQRLPTNSAYTPMNRQTPVLGQYTPVSPGRHTPPVQTRQGAYEQSTNYHQTASTTLIDDWERRGDKLFAAHDYEEAAKAYRCSLEVAPNKSTTWLALGDTYFALEDYVQALNAYDQAMKLNPNDSLTWSNKGTVLDALGRHKEAMDCYERAEQLK